MEKEIITEEQAREMADCVGCGKVKSKGLVVCWDCFKYRKDVTPLKYFPGELSQWLIQLIEKGA